MIYTFGEHNMKCTDSKSVILNQWFLVVPQQNQFCYFVSFVNMYPLQYLYNIIQQTLKQQLTSINPFPVLILWH